MISVIIPALNEEKTVGHVVSQALRSAHVTEVVVVDDKSLDNTVGVARSHGAKVITSTKLGKGVSMKDGIQIAQNEFVAFLDADITTYPDDVVERLTGPLVRNEADFVKSYFERQAGRVTELVAKPLLSIMHPDFPSFRQPLSGMIAGRKSMFEKLSFEEGYGVDIGILIDMHRMNARIQEVNLGRIENDMQPLEELGKMSRQVAGTIIKKASGQSLSNLETYENIQVIRGQMEFAIRESLMSLKKLAIFDMDNTILRKSFIRTAAEKFGFAQQLKNIAAENHNPFTRTILIAKLLKGKTLGELLEVADSIPVTPYLHEIVDMLKSEGYIVGIISDSYDCITNHLRNKFGFDFTVSNELEFSKSIATGEVKIPSLFIASSKSRCKHDYCKLNAMLRLCEEYGVERKNTMVIGDGENDICCIWEAGIGVSFCSTNPQVDASADFVIKDADFRLLTTILV
jgi:phosphoserine phosphatase SerB